MRVLALLLLLILSLSLGYVGYAQDDGHRVALDLPNNGSAVEEEADEDEPEAIHFYGIEVEGDAFGWCLDRSYSMTGARIATLKQEATEAVQQLSRNSEFTISSYATNWTYCFPGTRTANPANKLIALNYINSLEPIGGTAPTPALVWTILQLNESSKSKKVVMFLGDGNLTVPGMEEECILDSVSANYEGFPVNTFLIQGHLFGGVLYGPEFMEALASAHGGRYYYIP